MTTLLGIVALLFGLQMLVGQLISALDFELAQKLTLQEKTQGTDKLFRTLERHTATWDIVVAWVLSLAGILMIIDHDWWPYVALVAGGIYLDLGGRELAKWLALRSEHVKTGTTREFHIAQYFLGFSSLFGLALIIFSFTQAV